MVDWPEGCGEPLNATGWTEWYCNTGELYNEYFHWPPAARDFEPKAVCGSHRGAKHLFHWMYYCSRCARRLGLLW